MINQNSNFICPRCDSLYLIEKIHPEQTHYGRLICGDCGRFIRWLPRPQRLSICEQKEFIRQYGWVYGWDYRRIYGYPDIN